jgi:hypothetical protein
MSCKPKSWAQGVIKEDLGKSLIDTQGSPSPLITNRLWQPMEMSKRELQDRSSWRSLGEAYVKWSWCGWWWWWISWIAVPGHSEMSEWRAGLHSDLVCLNSPHSLRQAQEGMFWSNNSCCLEAFLSAQLSLRCSADTLFVQLNLRRTKCSREKVVIICELKFLHVIWAHALFLPLINVINK